MSNREQAGLTAIRERRDSHMRLCGLDAFCRTADKWLECAVAAEARGHVSLQSDYELAADLRERFDSARRAALANGDEGK